MTVKIPSLYILVTNIIVKNQNLKKKNWQRRPLYQRHVLKA